MHGRRFTPGEVRRQLSIYRVKYKPVARADAMLIYAMLVI
jgi:hypothetical protein